MQAQFPPTTRKPQQAAYCVGRPAGTNGKATVRAQAHRGGPLLGSHARLASKRPGAPAEARRAGLGGGGKSGEGRGGEHGACVQQQARR